MTIYQNNDPVVLKSEKSQKKLVVKPQTRSRSKISIEGPKKYMFANGQFNPYLDNKVSTVPLKYKKKTPRLFRNDSDRSKTKFEVLN